MLKKRIKKWYTLGLVIMMFINCQITGAKPNTQSPALSSEEIKKFSDAFFAEKMKDYHVPGAAISVVKDGEICFMQGYGYADVENKKRVDPEKTLFGIASVSKLITATAVMQQYEEGKIDLNQDVNSYLKVFKIKETFSEPVTMKSLLTHTSGFNQYNIGIGTRSTSKIESLEDYLKTAIPKRAYAPGRFFSYSNQGMSLAGYIVQKVSGKPFADYVDEKIFVPLEMENSTFRQPLEPKLEANKAAGYSYWAQKKSLFKTQPMYYQAVPAGACYTTVSDMAHFMTAHLQEGFYHQYPLLKEETIQEMHKQQFTHHPKMPGQAYGFWESNSHGQRGLFHTGTSDGYASLMYLIPEQHIGFMLCYNMATDKLRSDFLNSFLDKFFPEGEAEKIVPIQAYKERVKAFEGLYWGVEKPKYTLDKLEVLMSDGLVRAKAQKDGSLKLTDYYGTPMGEYVETEENIFTKTDGKQTIAFRQEKGTKHPKYLLIKNNAFTKVSWYESPTPYVGAGLLSILLILIISVIWLREAVRKNKRPEEGQGVEKYAEVIGIFTAVLAVTFCVVTAVITGKLGKYAFMFGVPQSVRVILIIPLILCGLNLFLLWINLKAWKNKCWTFRRHLILGVYNAALTAFIIFLGFWNMLSL